MLLIILTSELLDEEENVELDPELLFCSVNPQWFNSKIQTTVSKHFCDCFSFLTVIFGPTRSPVLPCLILLQRACWGRPAVQTACAPEPPWSPPTSRAAPNCGIWSRTTTTRIRGKETEGARWSLRSTWRDCWPPRYGEAVFPHTHLRANIPLLPIALSCWPLPPAAPTDLCLVVVSKLINMFHNLLHKAKHMHRNECVCVLIKRLTFDYWVVWSVLLGPVGGLRAFRPKAFML